MSFDFHTLAMPGIAEIAPYVPGKPLHEVAREFGLTDVVKLASNESPIGCSEKVTAHLQQQLSDIFRYPDGDGLDLKQALANKLNVDVNKISLGNGSNDILEFVARIFAGPEREIIYSQYGFAVYSLVTQVVGAKGIEVPARDWGHDLNAMAAAVTDRTRVIYIANPNNPTGTWLSQTDIEAFLAKIPAHVIVVLDEAYFEYVDDTDFPNGIELVDRYPQLSPRSSQANLNNVPHPPS